MARKGDYLPLTPANAAEQRKKLDSKEVPKELRVIKESVAAKIRTSIDEDPIVRLVQVAVDVNLSSDFDESEEGRWRATGDASLVHAGELYTNRFVTKAMEEIH